MGKPPRPQSQQAPGSPGQAGHMLPARLALLPSLRPPPAPARGPTAWEQVTAQATAGRQLNLNKGGFSG